MRVAVVGGGLSGLAAAYELAKRDVSISVFESSSYLGGLAASFDRRGKKIPICYHHISKLDTVTLHYLEEFKLSNQLIWKKMGTDFYIDGKPHRLSTPLDVLRFNPLGLMDRFRLAKGLTSCYLNDDADVEDGDQFATERFGESAKWLLFEPLSQIKYGLPLSSVSAKWLSHRMHVTAHIREEYAYPRFGLNQLVDAFENGITQHKGLIFRNSNVASLGPLDAYDRIILTLPGVFLNDIIGEDFGIQYCPAISCVIGADQSIVRNYWNIMISPRTTFGGIFNHTMLNPDSATREGENIYYVFTYGGWMGLSRDQVRYRFLEELSKLGMNLKPNWVEVFKMKYSQPIFSVNYQNPPMKVSSKIYLAGVFREYPNPRTMNSALMSGRNTAMKILEDFS